MFVINKKLNMKRYTQLTMIFGLTVLMASCVGKKKFTASQDELNATKGELSQYVIKIGELEAELQACQQEKAAVLADLDDSSEMTQDQSTEINNLKRQITDLKDQRDQQYAQIQDLTVLTQSANDNIGKTLNQLEERDRYIQLLQSAKSKTDSINLALAVNLKSALAEGVFDNDVEIKIDKTVVFINLSDKMLYRSGSANLTSRANEVLGKIAKIIAGRDDLEIMVEGYTDNIPIRNSCLQDNWDLSVKRATAVVRVLQDKYGVNPDNLIAAGRGEHNALADNSTAEGRSTNRRTRILILPKLDQFYDLLNPDLN